MPSEVKYFFTAAKALTPEAACIEFAHKLFNGSKAYRTYLIHNTIKCISQMNIVIF